MVKFKDESGRTYKLALDGASGAVVKTYENEPVRRPDAVKGLPSPAYDDVKCPDCGKVGVAHKTVGERCPAEVTKAKPRVCLSCHRVQPPASKDDVANPNGLCFHCGAQLDPDREPMEKRQAEQTRHLAAMARSGHSEISRRGVAALTRQLGPIVAADLVNGR